MLERAQKVKLLLLDVDGVMTDGRIIYDNYNDEIKNFNVNDGLGIVLLKRAGLKCAIVTAQSSPAVKRRAKALGIDRIYQGYHFKIKALEKIKNDFRVNEEDICYIGDDIVDIPILKRAGFAVCVTNAMEDVKKSCHYVTEQAGGYGAVREVCEILLKAQNKWDYVTRSYFL